MSVLEFLPRVLNAEMTSARQTKELCPTGTGWNGLFPSQKWGSIPMMYHSKNGMIMLNRKLLCHMGLALYCLFLWEKKKVTKWQHWMPPKHSRMCFGCIKCGPCSSLPLASSTKRLKMTRRKNFHTLDWILPAHEEKKKEKKKGLITDIIKLEEIKVGAPQ